MKFLRLTFLCGLAAIVLAVNSIPAATNVDSLPPKLVMKDGGVMVLVHLGLYVIGSNDGPQNTRPAHNVNLPSFYIDQCEITNAQYRKFCLETGHAFPPYFKKGQIPEGKEKMPVVYVNYYDAQEYARWTNKKLPTESQWEAAARGPKSTVYPWGDIFKPFAAIRRNKPAEVGSFKDDIAYYGVMDMTGNVMEWTRDWYQSYPGSPKKFDFQGSKAVVKGGFFGSRGAADCRPYLRRPALKSTRSPRIGFRCIREIGG